MSGTLIPWEHFGLHGMVPPFQILKEASNENGIVEIAMESWNGKRCVWRFKVDELDGSEETWKARGELLSSTTLGDAPEFFSDNDVLYVAKVEAEEEETNPLKPEIAEGDLPLPDRLNVQFAEIKINESPRGVSSDAPYYSPHGGAITHDGAWLSIEGDFMGSEFGALATRLADVVAEEVELRAAPISESGASLPMRFTLVDGSVLMGDNRKVTLQGASDPLEHE